MDHPLHWALNAAGLWYIGRRVEALAGWPHLALVFLVAMVAGGVTTAQFLPDQDSVGASGGLLGLLGFLLVFETLHPRLVPHPTRRRLFAALVPHLPRWFCRLPFHRQLRTRGWLGSRDALRRDRLSQVPLCPSSPRQLDGPPLWGRIAGRLISCRPGGGCTHAGILRSSFPLTPGIVYE